MDPRPRLQCTDLAYSYGGPDVLHGVSLRVDAGERVGLVGPNGSGKSTLLQVAAGLLAPSVGTVEVCGQPLGARSHRELARDVAWVPQEFDLAFSFTVREVVLTGRYPHLGWLGLEGADDLEIARRAMDQAGIEALADRPFQALSGGERQRAVIAAALAQEPQVLLLDEPTSNLDLHHQHGLMQVLNDRATVDGTAVLMAIHDLNLALAWCPRVLMLDRGQVIADGAPDEVFTAERLARVYGAGARVIEHGGRTAVLPDGPPEVTPGA
jgi:iron complex transport system ATP-binding protein